MWRLASSTPPKAGASQQDYVCVTPAGVRVTLRVQPKAARDGFRGTRGGALKVAVSAAPEGGKANQAVIELLAECLRIAKSRISVISGVTSQNKLVLISAASTECAAIAERLRAVAQSAAG